MKNFIYCSPEGLFNNFWYILQMGDVKFELVRLAMISVVFFQSFAYLVYEHSFWPGKRFCHDLFKRTYRLSSRGISLVLLSAGGIKKLLYS